MAISSQPSGDGTTINISITDRFDFSVHRDLRVAYEAARKGNGHYVIDLYGACYMDSSALGMLLQMRAYAGGHKEAVRIKNAGPAIKDILRIANFDKLMVVE